MSKIDMQSYMELNKKMYAVLDFTESYFGDVIFESFDYEECRKFAKEYYEENYGECSLRILQEQ